MLTDQEIFKAAAGWREYDAPEGCIGDIAQVVYGACRAVLALAEGKSAAKVAELEMAERQRNVFAQQVNEYAEEARTMRARIAELKAAASNALKQAYAYPWASGAFIRLLEDAMSAQPAQVAAPTQADGWQPIETAPKDGRKLIVWYTNRNLKPRTVFARWLTDEQAAETDGDGVGLEAGWYECVDNWADYTEVAIHEGEPTHWMPLPAAPKREGGK
jgi:hypothetical protein